MKVHIGADIVLHTLYPLIGVLLLFSLGFNLSTFFDFVYASTHINRKYSPMSVEESKQLVARIIEEGKFPDPMWGSWKLPVPKSHLGKQLGSHLKNKVLPIKGRVIEINM